MEIFLVLSFAIIGIVIYVAIESSKVRKVDDELAAKCEKIGIDHSLLSEVWDTRYFIKDDSVIFFKYSYTWIVEKIELKQIADIEIRNSTATISNIEKGKSGIGRAIVGGAIAGPAGALIGHASRKKDQVHINTSENFHFTIYYVVDDSFRSFDISYIGSHPQGGHHVYQEFQKLKLKLESLVAQIQNE